MKHEQFCLVKRAVCRTAAIVSLLLIGAGAALAQGRVGAPSVINPKGDTDAQTNREAALRSAEIRVGGVTMDQQHLTAAIERTKQDFKRIQLIRNDVVDTLVAKKPLDYNQVSEQAAEINKRAIRLKSFMMQPDLEEKDKDTALRLNMTANKSKARSSNFAIQSTASPTIPCSKTPPPLMPGKLRLPEAT